MMFERNLAYEASAGSGKTFMLVVRYLSLLFMGADPAKILALTFTNKAANEMQERIVATLEHLQERAELEVIAQTTGIKTNELLLRRKRVLAAFLQADTKIMTIDSFFTKILRKFSLHIGLAGDFTTAAAQHEVKLLSRFLQEVSAHNAKNTLISLLIDSKKSLKEVLFLLEDFYVKSKELGDFRFTYGDAKALQHEAMQIVQAMRMLVEEAPNASKHAKSAFVIDRFEDIVKKGWFGRETLEYRTFAKCYTPRLDTLLLQLYDVMRRYFQIREQNFFYALDELATLYQKAKKALSKADNEIGFSDVTILVYALLKEYVSKEFLYFRLDAKIEHILLDEFQDTSILQYEILHPLIEEALAGKGAKEEGSFFFVGHVKQSIYRFRGGVSALFYEVARLNGTKVEKLTTNYRSKEQIVSFVNEIFRNKIKNYTDQKVQKGADGGFVAVRQSDDVLETIALETKRLVEAGAKEEDIAILCATNTDGEVIKEYLSARGHNVVTETTMKLIHQKGVAALFWYLCYIYFKVDIAKENFFALIGKEVTVTFVDFDKRSPTAIVKEAIERYELFDGDFNLLRFLEVVGEFHSIEALLFEYERIETQALSGTLEGIKVLTIHKSKGLEYPHVIVADRLSLVPSDRTPIIYDYDGVVLQNIYLRQKGREMLDSAYEEAIERSKKLAEEDALNAFYVAFTRSKENLFVIAKTQKSSFNILDLHPMEQGELRITQTAGEAMSQSPKAPRYKELYYGMQSDLLEKTKEETQDSFAAQHFGTAMHYLLEMLEAFTLEALDEAIDALQNRFGTLLEPKDIEAVIKRVRTLLQTESFLELVAWGECLKEQPIRYDKKLFVIDLLVLTPSEAIVIDYKSGKERHEEHIKQVQGYKRAVSDITKQPVKGVLCYLLEGGIEIVQVK